MATKYQEADAGLHRSLGVSVPMLTVNQSVTAIRRREWLERCLTMARTALAVIEYCHTLNNLALDSD